MFQFITTLPAFQWILVDFYRTLNDLLQNYDLLCDSSLHKCVFATVSIYVDNVTDKWQKIKSVDKLTEARTITGLLCSYSKRQ